MESPIHPLGIHRRPVPLQVLVEIRVGVRSERDRAMCHAGGFGEYEPEHVGDEREVGVGDLVLIPPATDHSIANDGADTLALVSVQPPAVSADELYSRRPAAQASGYDDDEYE